MFKKKKKIERIDFQDENAEEQYETEGEQEDEDVDDEPELPPLPKRGRKQIRKDKPEEDPEESTTMPRTNTSEYLDIIEGNIKRAYLALDELRKIAKV